MRFLPSRPAGRIKKRRRPAHNSWTNLRRFFGLWMGCGHRCRNAICDRTPTKPGVSKGGLCLPFGTQPCLQGVVCYTCWRGLQGKAGAVRFAPRFPRQENGRGFVTGREQKLSVFRERQQVYKVPTCRRKQQYYLFIIFPTFLIEIDIVPFGLFINSMYSELSKKSEGIVISIPVSVLILCFLPSRMA